MDDLLRALALAKLEFQLRAIKAAVVAPNLEVAMTCPLPEADPDDKVAAIIRALDDGTMK